MSGGDGWPVIGERWARGERPDGAPEQVRAWLDASLVPLTVRIVRGNEDGDVWFYWERCGAGPMVPTQGTDWVQFPDEGTVWQPVRSPLTFRAPLSEFVTYFWRVP